MTMMCARCGLLLISVFITVFISGCAMFEPTPPPNVGNRVYVADESGNSVSVIDATTLTPMKTVALNLKGTHDFALTQDGHFLHRTRSPAPSP